MKITCPKCGCVASFSNATVDDVPCPTCRHNLTPTNPKGSVWEYRSVAIGGRLANHWMLVGCFPRVVEDGVPTYVEICSTWLVHNNNVRYIPYWRLSDNTYQVILDGLHGYYPSAAFVDREDW